MAKYMMIFGVGLMIMASIVYARRGPVDNVFDDEINHPLEGYADQIIEPPPTVLMAPAESGAGELDLFE